MNAKTKIVLVTGASSGFGLSIARDLTTAGYRVFGASRRADGGLDPHGGFETIRMDVDDDASVESGVAAVAQRAGGLDAVVSNAGIGIAGALEDTSSAEAMAQFQTNFFGNHRVCRAALPHLRASAWGRIVVIGSLAGRMAIPFQGMYSASKFALEGYCEALSMELRKTPVRVTILEPGDFATGFTAARVMAGASGEGSAYRAAFEAALAVIEKDETTGADPALLSQAVRATLEAADPLLRQPVGAFSQTAIAYAKPFIPPKVLEGLIADHFKC